MRRRLYRPFRRQADLDFVDHVLNEVKRELAKDPEMTEKLHGQLEEKRGRQLLTGLLTSELIKKNSPIYN